ncbi:T9SS type A sorting domain-containing protein [candidate division KSB1 bacterium]|nr:T9SS type A sorting domain-containing protein [candidate division KSB1 bacterium]
MKRMFSLFIALTLYSSITAQTTFEKRIESINDENSFSIQACNDNTYVLCGYTVDFYSGKQDIYVVKIDYKGDTLWTKQFGEEFLYSCGYSIYQTNDFGYIVAGDLSSTNSAPFLLKLDINGNQEWLEDYSSTIPDGTATSVIQAFNNDIVFCGNSQYTNAKDNRLGRKPFLIRANENGEIIWNETYGDIGRAHYGSDLVQNTDSSFSICGQYGTQDPYDKAWLISANQNGALNWDITFGDNTTTELFKGIKRTSDDGFILCGTKSSNIISGKDVYVVKTDIYGNVEWSKTFGGEANDYGNAVDITNDGGYIICGSTESYGEGLSDCWLIRLDNNGDTLWTRSFGDNFYDRASDVSTTNDGGFILCGYTTSYGDLNSDIYIIKTDEFGIVTGVENNLVKEESIRLFPNPFKNEILIELKLEYQSIEIYNQKGAQVYKETFDEIDTKQKLIKLDCLPKGLYFLNIKTDKQELIRKIIKN